MKRRYLYLKSLLLLFLLVGTAVNSSAYDFSSNGLYYSITSSSSKTVAVTENPNTYSGSVVIPSTVTYGGTTYTVTSVDYNAFGMSGITSVVIPSTVTRIGKYAFYGCFDLNSVTIGSSVSLIDEYAFVFCDGISTINCLASTPPTIYDMTFNLYYGGGMYLDDAVVRVPSSSLSAYNSTLWGEFNHIEGFDGVVLNLATFPDHNFRDYMTSLYPKGYMTNGDIANLTTLSVYSKGIANMKGIEFLTALKELRCWSNPFTSLNLSSNTELTYLDCAPNSNLTSLYLSNCSKLQTLICYSTGLTSLSVWGKPNLTKLNCYDCPSLKNLYCYSNNLTTLNVTGCTALMNLQCYYNYNLTEITGLNDCTAITYLDCEDCAITNLSPVNSMNNLEKLYCRNNQITSLTVTNKSYLNYVRASGNSLLNAAYITSNPSLTTLYINDCTALETLYCYANNLLSTLNVTGNSTLKDLRCFGSYGSTTALTTLDLTGTTALTNLDCGNISSLTSITNLASCTAMKTFLCQNTAMTSLSLDNLSNLEYLNCSNTKLTSLKVTNKSKLTEINAYNNPQMTTATITGNSTLTSLSIYGCSRLQTLDCFSNKLSSLNLTGNTALETLDCSGNTSMSSFNGLSDCYNLTNLNFGRCNFSSFNPSSLASLQYLYCFNNSLSSLNVSNLEDLVFLSCGDNNLTTLNLSNNYMLNILGCANNRLTSLNLSNNTDLQTVTCDGNQLTSINVQGLNSMWYLNCANNKLASLFVQGCNALYYIKCDQNKINGSGMTTLVNSLRNRSTTSQGYLLALNNSNENNAMTATHIATATAKNWMPYYFNGSSWEEYSPHIVGDVDGDGNVSISDVTALIDILLSGGTAPAAADVNGDGIVSIADVTALIDMLLSGNAKGAKLSNADLMKSIDLVEQQLKGIK